MNGHPPYQTGGPWGATQGAQIPQPNNPQLGYPPPSPHPQPPPPQYQPRGQHPYDPYGQAPPQQPQYQQPPAQPQHHQQPPQQPQPQVGLQHPPPPQPQQPHHSQYQPQLQHQHYQSQYAFPSHQQYATPVQGFAGGPQGPYQQPPVHSQYLPPLPPRPPLFSPLPMTPAGGKVGGLARIGASVAGKIQGYLAKTQQPATGPQPSGLGAPTTGLPPQQYPQSFPGVGGSLPAAAQPYAQPYTAQSPPVPSVSNWQQPGVPSGSISTPATTVSLGAISPVPTSASAPWVSSPMTAPAPSPPTWTSQAPAHPMPQGYFAVSPPAVQQYQTPPVPHPQPAPNNPTSQPSAPGNQAHHQTQLPYVQPASPHPAVQSPSQGPATSPPPIQYSQISPAYATPPVPPTPPPQTQGPMNPAAPFPQQYQTQPSGKEQTPVRFTSPITQAQEQVSSPVAAASHQPQPQPPVACAQSYPVYAPAVTSPSGQQVQAPAPPPQAQPPHIPASSPSGQYQAPSPTPQQQSQQLATPQPFTNLHQPHHHASEPVVSHPMPLPTAMQFQTTLPIQQSLANPGPPSQVPGQPLQPQPLSPQAQSPPPVQHHQPDLPVASAQPPPIPAKIELPSTPVSWSATSPPSIESHVLVQSPSQQDSSQADVKASSPTSPSYQQISQQPPTSASAAETVSPQSPIKPPPSYQPYRPSQDHSTQAAQFSSPPPLSVNQQKIKRGGETDRAPEPVLAHLASGVQNLSVSSHSATDTAKDGQPAGSSTATPVAPKPLDEQRVQNNNSSTFKPAEIPSGTQNERSGTENNPSNDAGLVCVTGIKIKEETDWHIHPSAPSFFICPSCFSELDPTSTFAMSCSIIRKGSVHCHWNRARIVYDLWPEAQRSGNLTALLVWMKRRSEEIRDCKGLGVGVSHADGMKWFSPAQNEVPGFIACEACYEETVLATPIGSKFALNPTPMNDGATCDIPVPYIHRLLVKQPKKATDWQRFVERARTRLGLRPCPTTTHRHESEGNWWTVTGVGGSAFSICEACFADQVDGNEVLEKLFEQIPLQSLPGGHPTDRGYNCDYYINVALEHVIQMANHHKWDLEKTRSTLVAVVSKPRCAMPDGLENGLYYNFHDEVPDFGVCEACYIGLFKTHGWERHFKDQPKMIPGKTFCVFHPKLNRGFHFRSKYFQLVQGTAQFSDWEAEVRKWNPIPLCPTFEGAKNRLWWGWNNCTACEECFNTVIVGTRYEKTLPSQAHFLADSNICCLYSPRMRALYKEACETGDIDKFMAFCSERMEIYHKTVPRVLMLRFEIQNDYNMWMIQSSWAQSQRFANSISSIGGTDTVYTSNATGNTYETYAGIVAEEAQATADGMFARAQGRGRQHEMFTLASIWSKYE